MYTAKIDVYAFAMILYEAVERQRPWHEVNFTYKIFRKVEKGERPPISKNRLSIVPQELVTLMRQCWDHDPNRRPDFKQVGHRIHDIQTALHIDSVQEDTASSDDDEPPRLLSHDASHNPDHIKSNADVVPTSSSKEVEMTSLYPV